jgi:hypothetical protein
MAAKMNQEIKAKWVAALRSGEYKQGQKYLNGAGGFCCLGVLCDLAVKEGLAEWKVCESWGYLSVQGYTAVLPMSIAKWAGLPMLDLGPEIGPSGASLAHLNDGGFSFTQIASLIEEKL